MNGFRLIRMTKEFLEIWLNVIETVFGTQFKKLLKSSLRNGEVNKDWSTKNLPSKMMKDLRCLNRKIPP